MNLYEYCERANVTIILMCIALRNYMTSHRKDNSVHLDLRLMSAWRPRASARAAYVTHL